MDHTSIWSNINNVKTICSKCNTEIESYYPIKCLVCQEVFCSKCSKKCQKCRKDYCKKCSKLYKFKKNICLTCRDSTSKCVIN